MLTELITLCGTQSCVFELKCVIQTNGMVLTGTLIRTGYLYGITESIQGRVNSKFFSWIATVLLSHSEVLLALIGQLVIFSPFNFGRPRWKLFGRIGFQHSYHE